VVEGAALEMLCRATYRGFESLPLRYPISINGERGIRTLDRAPFALLGSQQKGHREGGPESLLIFSVSHYEIP
jgi:hypothetical protein